MRLDDRTHAIPKHPVESVEGPEVVALVEPERLPGLSPLFDLRSDLVARHARKVLLDLLGDIEFGLDVPVGRFRVADAPDLRSPLTGILHEPAEVQNHFSVGDLAAQVEFEPVLQFVG